MSWWLGIPPAEALVDCAGERHGLRWEAGELRALARAGDRVEVTLPFAWLVRVWARGLATVAGRFCLDAVTEDGRAFTLSTVAPDLGPPQPMTLTMPA